MKYICLCLVDSRPVWHWWTNWAPAKGYIPASGVGEEDALVPLTPSDGEYYAYRIVLSGHFSLLWQVSILITVAIGAARTAWKWTVGLESEPYSFIRLRGHCEQAYCSTRHEHILLQNYYKNLSSIPILLRFIPVVNRHILWFCLNQPCQNTCSVQSNVSAPEPPPSFHLKLTEPWSLCSQGCAISSPSLLLLLVELDLIVTRYIASQNTETLLLPK